MITLDLDHHWQYMKLGWCTHVIIVYVRVYGLYDIWRSLVCHLFVVIAKGRKMGVRSSICLCVLRVSQKDRMNFWYVENNCDWKQLKKDKYEQICFLKSNYSFLLIFYEFLVILTYLTLKKKHLDLFLKILAFYGFNAINLAHKISFMKIFEKKVFNNMWK